MKKLNLAIVGQGRSGRDIHGRFLKTENNKWFNVKYIVEADDVRRAKAETEYDCIVPQMTAFSSLRHCIKLSLSLFG